MLKKPNFVINAQAIPTQLETLLEQQRGVIQSLEQLPEPTWDNFITHLDDLSDNLNQFWGPISHLNSVANTDELRTAYETCLPLLSDFFTELGQNKAIFKQYSAIKNGDEYQQLNKIQQRVIDLAIRDFQLSGIDLPAEKQARYKEIVSQLSLLTTKFENNLIDSTKHWHYLLGDKADLSGIPAARQQAMQAAAEQHQQTGYRVTIDYPCYHDVITFADQRELREKIYQAFATRASDQNSVFNDYDNAPLIEEIVRLRTELAELLGYQNYAAMSVVPKMAKDPEQVEQFLAQLATKVKPKAKQDLAELKTFAQQYSNNDNLELQPWDVAYYSEKMRQQEYAVSQEDIKQYFPAQHVIQGLFSVIHKLYDIQLVEEKTENLWHSDVKFYQLLDTEKNIIGGIYMDLYARDNKRSGAWMDDAVCRRQLASGEIQYPIAYLNCNFANATKDTPALLTHNDVETLFHEMGHCLHHLLTQINYLDVAGINNVPWDTVEFPSQFFEAWAWEPESLKLLSSHYQTGESLPDDLIEKMIAAKNFQAGLFLIRQLEFAIFDIELYSQQPDDLKSAQTILDDVRNHYSVMKPPSYNRFANSFSHIFAGGYAAGYYSYLWAEVLARDAFSAFIENGIFDKATGQRFKNTVLALGGSEAPELVFEKFMGRAPDNDALLTAYGF